MKKLMIAAVAVAMAACASAATTNWKFNLGNTTLKDGYLKATDKDHTAVKMTDTTVYLIDAYCTYGGKTGQEAFLLALAAGESIADYAIKDKDGNAVTAETDANGQIKANNANANTFSRTDLVVGKDSLNGFAAVVINDEGGKAEYVFLSAATGDKTALDSAQTQGLPPGAAPSANYIGSQWTGDAGWYTVPEPTSGLLLLLGVAGLALRRRRA